MNLTPIVFNIILLFQLVIASSYSLADEDHASCNKELAIDEEVILNRPQIEDLLPHRGPLLLVDRVTKLQTQNTGEFPLAIGSSITAELDIHKDLEIFKYHYPKNPIFPGNLVSESIEQAAALLVLIYCKSNETLFPILKGVSSQEIKAPVIPKEGSSYPLTLKVTLVDIKNKDFIFDGKAILPNGKVAVELKEIKATALNERLLNRLAKLSSKAN